jgi:tRNA(Ile)-lysidine synthase
MNADPKFGRSRIRAAWPQLAELGLSPLRIADAAKHLARARTVLEGLTEGFLQRGVRFAEAGALLDSLRLKMLPPEVGLRALAAVLSRVSGEAYRPRFESLERLFESIIGGSLGGGATLHGCMVAPATPKDQVFGSATITLSREPERRSREPAAPSPRKSSSEGRGN